MVGQIVSGRLSTADASGGVVVPLFAADGSSRVQLAGEAYNVTDVVVTSATAMTVTIGFDDLAAGKIIAKVILTASVPTVILNLTTAEVGPVGKGVKVLSSLAGQLDVMCNGVLA